MSLQNPALKPPGHTTSAAACQSLDTLVPAQPAGLTDTDDTKAMKDDLTELNGEELAAQQEAGITAMNVVSGEKAAQRMEKGSYQYTYGYALGGSPNNLKASALGQT